MKRLSATLLICVVLGLLSLSSAVLAQYNPIQPALPGSVEYGLTAQGYTWVRTSAPITVGSYVEDLMLYRWAQPLGRGIIGIVTATGWNPEYGQMAAMVDFGRSYSVGLNFPELSAVRVPEPSSLLVLLSGIGLVAIRVRRRRLLG